MEKIKVKRDKKRRMNFGPHHEKTYGEVLREEPEYVKALIKENRRDNQKSRFAHWAMAYSGNLLFQRGRETRRGENRRGGIRDRSARCSWIGKREDQTEKANQFRKGERKERGRRTGHR